MNCFLFCFSSQMPVLGGIEATRILRSMGLTIPIVALTGEALQEDQEAFMEAGAVQVLSKVRIDTNFHCSKR